MRNRTAKDVWKDLAQEHSDGSIYETNEGPGNTKLASVERRK